MYNVTFKENRKSELIINNQLVATFYGRETKELEDAVVESNDFQTAEKEYYIFEKIPVIPEEPVVKTKKGVKTDGDN